MSQAHVGFVSAQLFAFHKGTYLELNANPKNVSQNAKICYKTNKMVIVNDPKKEMGNQLQIANSKNKACPQKIILSVLSL